MEITDFRTFSKGYFMLSVCVTANLQRKNTPNFDVFPPAHSKCPPKQRGRDRAFPWSGTLVHPIKGKLTNTSVEVTWRKQQNNGGGVTEVQWKQKLNFYSAQAQLFFLKMQEILKTWQCLTPKFKLLHLARKVGEQRLKMGFLMDRK